VLAHELVTCATATSDQLGGGNPLQAHHHAGAHGILSVALRRIQPDDRDRGGGGAIGALLMLFLAPSRQRSFNLPFRRSREYGADETGAHVTGNPNALARALQKLDTYSKRRPMVATYHGAFVHRCNRWPGSTNASLFSTHPPIAKRIERLTGRPAELL